MESSLSTSGTVMGNSFVLFDVTIEISPRQFHPGETGHTQEVASPWATPICSWVKRLQPYLIWWTWSHVKTLFRLRLAKQQFCTCVTLFLFIFLKFVARLRCETSSFTFVLGMTWTQDNNFLLLLLLKFREVRPRLNVELFMRRTKL